METLSFAFLIICVFGAVAVVLVAQSSIRKVNKKVIARPEKRRSSKTTSSFSKSPHRAISITYGNNSCGAVEAIGGKRFIIKDTDLPKIPLRDCDAARCDCVYNHHEDRRDDENERRTLYPGLKTQLYQHSEKLERRVGRGRRATDWENQRVDYA